MNMSEEGLIQNYTSKNTEDLINIYFQGSLTEVAYDCLLNQLSSRGISTYDLYTKSDLSSLVERKKELQTTINKLQKEVHKLSEKRQTFLEKEEKTREPKKQGMLSLLLERKRLEEEAKIKTLKEKIDD